MVRPADPQLLEFLAVHDRPVGPLALALREIVLEEAPEAVERIFRNHPSALWFGAGPRMQDMFGYVAMASRHVNLGFCRGAALADPDGVLEGAGKAMRHIKFRGQADLARPFVRPFIRAAAEPFGLAVAHMPDSN
jgi:hypothetical protein